MSYPAPPPAEQPPAQRGSAVGRVDAGGFFSDLFDIRFTRFVSLRLISIVYVLILAAVSLVALIAVFVGFAQGPGTGLLALVVAGLGWLIYVVLARVVLEAFAVLFRIHDDTSRMADGLAGPRAAGGPLPADPGAGPTQVQQYPYGQAAGGQPQAGYGDSGTPPWQ